MTWEKAENIPSEVILEFELGNEGATSDNTTPKMGQTMHTLTVNQRQRQHPRTGLRPIIQNNTGYVCVCMCVDFQTISIYVSALCVALNGCVVLRLVHEDVRC